MMHDDGPCLNRGKVQFTEATFALRLLASLVNGVFEIVTTHMFEDH
jgi:hypothetical protein